MTDGERLRIIGKLAMRSRARLQKGISKTDNAIDDFQVIYFLTCMDERSLRIHQPWLFDSPIYPDE